MMGGESGPVLCTAVVALNYEIEDIFVDRQGGNLFLRSPKTVKNIKTDVVIDNMSSHSHEVTSLL